MAITVTLDDIIKFMLAGLGVGIPVIALLFRNLAQSQKIIIEDYKRLRETVEKEQDARVQQAVDFASIKGGLESQLLETRLQLEFERKNGEERGAMNRERVAVLESKIHNLEEEQTNLSLKLRAVTDEKENAAKLLEKKETELNVANEALLKAQAQIDELTGIVKKLSEEVARLRKTVENKAREERSIREKLKGKPDNLS